MTFRRIFCRIFRSPLAVVVACCLLSGCSGESAEESEGEGSGGSVGTGGTIGTGGTATGGTGTGGVGIGGSSTGGTGSGGVGTGGFGSGGAPTSGGAPATGGEASTGGIDGSGGEQGSGGEGQGGYRPCPTDGPCKILPLGDSITHGMRREGNDYVFDGGYRIELFRLATEAGHDVTFTGTQPPNGPDTVAGAPFPKDHEGVSGDIITGIASRGVNAIEQEMPHIILVHAGTNDLNGMSDGMSDRLGALMDDLVESAPDALVVVSSLIPFNGGEEAYNATIEPMVAARAQADAHIIFVDQHADFPSEELGDGVHPTTEGYARMGAKWYGAIESYLP